ncbi:MAG: hypothetical protein ACREDQ_12680, partial [Limisphaerales bacterium]
MKVLDIITDAFLEICVYGHGEPVSGPDSAYALRKANRLLNSWNADEFYIYSKNFPTFAIPTNKVPNADKSVSFTIGPTGNAPAPDMVMPAGSNSRPLSIESANIILTNTQPYVKSPLNIRDDDWWHGQRVPGTSTQ